MKQKIIWKEIVKDISRGMTDSELTKKYSLSGGQLLSIFKQVAKLRERRIQMLVDDLRSGIALSELMKKYQLSAEGLASAVKRLLETKAISRDELNTFDSSHDSRQTRSSVGPEDSNVASSDHAGRLPSQPSGQGRGEGIVQHPRSNHTGGDFATPLRDYIEIIIRRKWVILTVFIAIFLIIAAYTYTCKPIYSSVATIEFEEKRPKQEDRVYGYLDYDQYKGYLATQLEILKSRGLAESLVAKMNLSESPEFSSKSSSIGRWFSAAVSGMFGSNDQKNVEDASAARMNGLSASVVSRVYVRPVKTSNLVAVSMDATNPSLANEMLRNYLDIYLERNLAKRRKESLEASAWLKKELAAVEKKLKESQAKLVAFLIDNGIAVSSTETGVSPTMELFNKTMETHTKSREARLRMQALEQQKVTEQGIVLPKNVNTEYIGKLKEQLALFESEYSQMKGLYSPSYPKMEMLSQKIKFLKDRILEIEKSIVDSALDTAKKEESLFKGSFDLARDESNRVKALGAQHMLLKKEVETNEEFHQMLLKEFRENDMKSRTINNNVRIIDPPSKPSNPRWPKKELFLLMGSLIGLVGGISAAFAVESLDNTVRTPEEIERDFKVRSLAIVPNLDRRRKLHGTELTATSYEFIAHEHPKSPMSDAVRNIQTSILLSNAHRSLSFMVVSSAIPSEGKTVIAISLATVLCSSEKKVVIVDADMRKPRIHKVFGHREPGPGLSTLLGPKGVKVSDVLHAHTIKGLFYITSGPAVSDHLPLIQSERMKKLVDQLRSTFDYIVLDTPPVLGFSDVSILCTYADGLILVAKQGHVGRDELREAIDATSSVNACQTLGVVLNKADAPGAYGYGFRYRYFGYGRGYYANYRHYGYKS